MKKFFMKVFIFCLIFFAFTSCKAFRISTEKTEIEVETAHMAHLSIICADDTNFLV